MLDERRRQPGVGLAETGRSRGVADFVPGDAAEGYGGDTSLGTGRGSAESPACETIEEAGVAAMVGTSENEVRRSSEELGCESFDTVLDSSNPEVYGVSQRWWYLRSSRRTGTS